MLTPAFGTVRRKQPNGGQVCSHTATAMLCWRDQLLFAVCDTEEMLVCHTNSLVCSMSPQFPGDAGYSSSSRPAGWRADNLCQPPLAPSHRSAWASAGVRSAAAQFMIKEFEQKYVDIDIWFFELYFTVGH